ncbi:MAG: hypothetical protein K2L55_02150 [Muribaculaceae bacterium]|nr:hypothetical protein [Muribaculaceae bacterium]
MKTSFYFVVWILIYPLLGLIDNQFVNRNSFLVALAAVWGLSMLLNRLMPSTLSYERHTQAAPILEDIFTSNVAAFGRRLRRDAVIETVTAVYLCLSTVAIMYLVFKLNVDGWMMLGIFAVITYGAIVRCVNLIKAKIALKSDPTRELCMEIARKNYMLDYESYHNARSTMSYEEMMSAHRPRHFNIFQIVSLLFAVASILLGLYYIVDGLSYIPYLSDTNLKLGLGSVVIIAFLYGSLAISFGVKDTISLINALRHKPSAINR